MKSGLAANNADANLSGGLKGFGIVQVPRILALSYLRTVKLVEIIESYRPAATTTSIVCPYHRHLSPQVQAFAEWIAELFERHPLLPIPASTCEIWPSAHLLATQIPQVQRL
ncbi:LysR substrate-binding domain-containing protein [Paraburkholderia sp. GAS334]|uniref:LysR substrate-binding domain-containing protein n=1 Tax=Paraburkholderia sp. GAS334 TaxID=3035131 RepID=UPI003D262059